MNLRKPLPWWGWGVGAVEHRSPHRRVIRGAGWDRPCTTGQNRSSKPEEDPEGTDSRRLSANHSCAKQPSCLEGVCISLPWPHAHLPGLPSRACWWLPCGNERPVRSHCRISPACLASVRSSPEGLAPGQPLADEEKELEKNRIHFPLFSGTALPISLTQCSGSAPRQWASVCGVNLLIHALSMGCRPCLGGRRESDTTEAT